MAIIKMLNSKTKQTNASMKKAVGYSLKMEAVNNLASGINCNFDTAYEEFCLTKKLFHKEKGRLYIHFEQSFPPDTIISNEKLHMLGRRLIQESQVFEGFQVVIGTHTDKDHIHNHFVLNTVNSETGQKWHHSNTDLKVLKELSLKICREENVYIHWDPFYENTKQKNKHNTANYGEYKKGQEGISWKDILKQNIDDCANLSNSKKSFIDEMKKRGYDVVWYDNHKYITFITPEGMKCRNNKLNPQENYSKESLLAAIENEVINENKQNPDHDQQPTISVKDAKTDKSDCFKTIMLCIKHSHSQDEFINNMKSLDYGVQWDHHKNIAFFTPFGRTFRDDSFYPYDRFTKEKLFAQFEKNSQRRSTRTRIDHQKEMRQITANVNNVKNVLQVMKNHNDAKNFHPYTKMDKKKNLEGDALKEKIKEKKTSTYNWDNEPDM